MTDVSANLVAIFVVECVILLPLALVMKPQAKPGPSQDLKQENFRERAPKRDVSWKYVSDNNRQ